jgi:hypothetical protein
MPQACLREPEAPRTWAVVAKATQTQPAHKRRCRMRKRGEQAASTRVLSLDAIWAPKLLEKWPSSAHTDPAGPGIVLASGLRSAADVSGSPEQSGPVGETRQHGAQPRPRGTVRTATRLGSYKRHRLVAAGSLDSQAKRHSGYTKRCAASTTKPATALKRAHPRKATAVSHAVGPQRTTRVALSRFFVTFLKTPTMNDAQ